jgi:hypothetical protein
MKIISGIILILISISSYAQKDIFIKEIDFNLEYISDKEYENEYFLTVKFNKGSTYKFQITNHINDKPGEAVFELLDGDKLVVTNVFGEKYYETFRFQCNKTGFYDILIKYKDNRLGHSKVDIYLQQ